MKKIIFGEAGECYILTTYEMYGGKKEIDKKEVTLASPIMLGGFIQIKDTAKAINGIGNTITSINTEDDVTSLGTDMYISYTITQK